LNLLQIMHRYDECERVQPEKETVMFGKLILGASLGLGILAAGCQTNNKAKAVADEPSTQALMCSKCETTFVKVRRPGKSGKIVGYRTREVMTCPGCKTVATGFFNTGKVHTCSICGDSMKACEAHEVD
jgi:protein-arginine kinase activator protein McsA